MSNINFPSGVNVTSIDVNEQDYYIALSTSSTNILLLTSLYRQVCEKLEMIPTFIQRILCGRSKTYGPIYDPFYDAGSEIAILILGNPLNVELEYRPLIEFDEESTYVETIMDVFCVHGTLIILSDLARRQCSYGVNQADIFEDHLTQNVYRRKGSIILVFQRV